MAAETRPAHERHKDYHDHVGHSAREKPKKWVAGVVEHMKKGALHRALHVPEGEKISAKKLDKAEHSKNPTLRKRAQFAKTLEGFHHK